MMFRKIADWPWWHIINTVIATGALSLALYQYYKHEQILSSASLRLEYIQKQNYRHLAIVNDGKAPANNVSLEWLGKAPPKGQWRFIFEPYVSFSELETILPNSRYIFYQSSFKPSGYEVAKIKITWTDVKTNSVTQVLPM